MGALSKTSETSPQRRKRWFIAATLIALVLVLAIAFAQHRFGRQAPVGMVWIPGGSFEMGTSDITAPSNERPAHKVTLSGFWMDRYDVTNAEFARFVAQTGYVTTAERAPTVEDIQRHMPPGAPQPDPGMLKAGGMVFVGSTEPVPLDDVGRWWRFVPGANWRHPQGPQSGIAGKDNYPVVQISYADAQAYALWAHKRLPTEAEWEYAARGGLVRARYAWGDDEQDRNRYAQLWDDQHATFPVVAESKLQVGTAPVGSFPPNGYGLYDMAGNVWQWVADWYSPDYFSQQSRLAHIVDPAGPMASALGADAPPARVTRGGSFLCSSMYCSSYRVSARQGNDPETSTDNLGFRLVMHPGN